jgi:prepilin-type processing-associated H-X9-DG protein
MYCPSKAADKSLNVKFDDTYFAVGSVGNIAYGLVSHPNWSAYLGTSAITSSSGDDKNLTLNFKAIKSSKMIFTDSSLGTGNQYHEWYCLNDDATMGFWHGGRANIGWSDGHVEAMDPKAVKTELDGTMTKVYGLIDNTVKAQANW